jgi:hypothetical protein
MEPPSPHPSPERAHDAGRRLCLVPFITCTVARRLCSAGGHGPSRSIRLRARRRRLRDSSRSDTVHSTMRGRRRELYGRTPTNDPGPQQLRLESGNRLRPHLSVPCSTVGAPEEARHIIDGCPIMRVINSQFATRSGVAIDPTATGPAQTCFVPFAYPDYCRPSIIEDRACGPSGQGHAQRRRRRVGFVLMARHAYAVCAAAATKNTRKTDLH